MTMLERVKASMSVSAGERRRLQNREAQRRRREKLRRIGLTNDEVRQVIEGEDEPAPAPAPLMPVPPPVTAPRQSDLASVPVKAPQEPNCQLAQSYFASKSSESAQLLMDSITANFAKWSLSDTQADLRFYLSTQPELFDKLLIALHFAHGISDRRDATVCLPQDNGPSIYFAIIKLYAARAKDKALGGSSSSYQSSWSPCSSMSLRVEAQPLFEAVISNATRLGCSSEEISDIDAVSGIGEKFLIGNGECCVRPGEPASAAPPSGGDVTTKKTRVDWSNIPENMHPTAKQMLSRHYPLIDAAFVWPSVRDKVLSLPGITADAVCYDMMISSIVNEGDPSFLVWDSDAMDPDSWEVGEAFARRWPFLFDRDIIARSNWWRKKRGLGPIKLDDIPTPSPSAASST